MWLSPLCVYYPLVGFLILSRLSISFHFLLRCGLLWLQHFQFRIKFSLSSFPKVNISWLASSSRCMVHFSFLSSGRPKNAFLYILENYCFHSLDYFISHFYIMYDHCTFHFKALFSGTVTLYTVSETSCQLIWSSICLNC